jgi:hypothetical protein
MLLTTFLPTQTASAYTTTVYSDDFNSYADNAAPSQSWYTFWTNFTYAKVNRTIHASNPFYINMSSATTVRKAVYFNFTTPYAYDSFQFYFTYLNQSSIRRNHTEMDFILKGTSTLATIKVKGNWSGTNKLITNRNRLLILDSTGTIKKNVSIGKSTQYLVTYTPDWDTTNLNVSVVNVSTGLPIAQCDVGISGQSELYSFQMYNYPASARVCIYLENFYLIKTVPTYTLYPAVEQMIVIVAVPVILAAFFIVFLLTGNITQETLIAFVIMFILYVVTLSILFS